MKVGDLVVFCHTFKDSVNKKPSVRRRDKGIVVRTYYRDGRKRASVFMFEGHYKNRREDILCTDYSWEVISESR